MEVDKETYPTSESLHHQATGELQKRGKGDLECQSWESKFLSETKRFHIATLSSVMITTSTTESKQKWTSEEAEKLRHSNITVVILKALNVPFTFQIPKNKANEEGVISHILIVYINVYAPTTWCRERALPFPRG